METDHAVPADADRTEYTPARRGAALVVQQLVTGLFSTSLMVLLGFIFLPTTLLWYACVQHWFGGQWTFWPIAGMVVALCADVSPAARRKRE
jgi:hypothetical protein